MNGEAAEAQLTLTKVCQRNVNLWIPMLGWNKRIPVAAYRSALEVGTGKNNDGQYGAQAGHDDDEPFQPFVHAAKETHQQDGDGYTRQYGNNESGRVGKPHPLQDVDDLIRTQAGIVLSETMVVGNRHKRLRYNVASLVEGGSSG